jgi:hypothetical protein
MKNYHQLHSVSSRINAGREERRKAAERVKMAGKVYLNSDSTVATLP